jgi:hypothetical protein
MKIKKEDIKVRKQVDSYSTVSREHKNKKAYDRKQFKKWSKE